MKAKISDKTLEDLEFSKVLDKISDYAISDLGRTRVLALKPIQNRVELKFELFQVNEYLASMLSENRIPNHYFEDISKELHLLEVEGSFLEEKAFQKILLQDETVGLLLTFLKKFKDYYPNLYGQSENLSRDPLIRPAIEAIISPHGEVLDKASERLFQIRKELGRIRASLGSSFTRALQKYSAQEYLDEIRESVVDHQRVLAVQAMYRKKVPGAILGSSRTGSIVYIAPEETLQLNRDLQNAQYEEREEIVTLLKTLTDKIRPSRENLAAYQNFLIKLDALGARAKYARDIEACLPKLAKQKKIFLKEAFHPVLLVENKSKGIETVPQTLELNEERQIIVISGPNAGGKSITLKTIGLLQVMLQSGILIPVDEKSEVYFFERILSDIGDNQSIENQLSTYSYRLKNMRNFLRACNDRTLFLIDEFGTGSDPELGGALAEVFLEEFYENGAYGIITTHYSNLKVLASELPKVVNANMEFDQRSLEPLYKLNVGQAGSSFTFEVAQKNGIPFSLINRAKKKVERDKLRLDKTIAKLQQERNALQKKTRALEAQQKLGADRVKEIEVQGQKIQDKINSFQELYDHQQKMLHLGRRFNEQLNRFFQTGDRKLFRTELMKWALIEKTKHEDKKKEKILTELSKKNEEREKPLSKRERTRLNKQLKLEAEKKAKALAQIEKELAPEVEKVRVKKKAVEREKALSTENYSFKINDVVRLKDGNAKGTIEKIEKNKVVINYGLFTATAKLDNLELITKAK